MRGAPICADLVLDRFGRCGSMGVMTVPVPPLKTQRHVRVVLSTTTLLSFISVSRATALALAELGIAVFFMAGVARSLIGESAPWYVLAACGLSAFVRTIDIESWGLFMPGGLIGRSERAFGPRWASIATAAVLTERLVLVSMACVLCGRYAVSFGAAWMSEWSVTARLTLQELVVVGATILIGLVWTHSRIGFPRFPTVAIARGIWVGVGVISALTAFGIATLRRQVSR